MSHFVFATWDGGGNVDVALGIGDALVHRGHRVTVLAPESHRQRVAAAGSGLREFGSPFPGPEGAAKYIGTTMGMPDRARDIELATTELDADLIVIDCNLFSSLEADVSVPVAVLVHTVGGLFLPPCQALVEQINAGLRQFGVPALADPAVSWPSRELLLITSWEAFDQGHAALSGASYTGPVRPPTSRGESVTTPPPRRTLILVSYSTHSLNNTPGRLQTALDGLADLPVDVIASCSNRFTAAELRVPANARVYPYLRHVEVMRHAAVVVGQAGHGTTTEAIAAGVPLVCIPALGIDQSAIAARVQELGLGIALAQGAGPSEIREAVQRLLDDPTHRSQVAAFRDRVGPIHGASNAADLLEAEVEGSNVPR